MADYLTGALVDEVRQSLLPMHSGVSGTGLAGIASGGTMMAGVLEKHKQEAAFLPLDVARLPAAVCWQRAGQMQGCGDGAEADGDARPDDHGGV